MSVVQQVPQARMNRAEQERLIRERMSENYVVVPAGLFDQKDDPETIKKLVSVWQ